MKECCKTGDEKPSGHRKILTRVFWGIIISIVLLIALMDML